jgi:hypothetical protein
LVDVEIETPATTTDAFIDDIRASLFAWRDVPLLPIVTAVLGAVTVVTIPPHDSFPVFVLGLAFGFFSFGWFGTQFIWYKQAFDRQPIRPGELFPLTWSFIARYVRLYFVALIPLFILVFVAIRWRTFGFASPAWRIGVLVYVLVFEIAGTFINPTLGDTAVTRMRHRPGAHLLDLAPDLAAERQALRARQRQPDCDFWVGRCPRATCPLLAGPSIAGPHSSC